MPNRGNFQLIRKTGFDKTVVFHHFINIYESEIGSRTKIGCFVEIAKSKIGKDCRILPFAFISAGTEIGDRTFVGPGVRILNDKYVDDFTRTKFQPCKIGNNVIIGSGAVILPGVTIGDKVRIGAGAVVTKDCFDTKGWYVGNPARIMKSRKHHDENTTE
jgi:acetyltransferase-like isoleucine patch superfamily enzyme